MTLLRPVSFESLAIARTSPLVPEIEEQAGATVADVAERGQSAIREQAERFGERAAGDELVLGRKAMASALKALSSADRELLERVADRVEQFARAQRASLVDIDVPLPGGVASQRVVPVDAAGCYSPAGRSPLPSSVLMTAVTARAAGVDRVVVASPGAHPLMLAAAAIAGADEFLAVGGAHAIAALAHGFEGFEPVSVIAGPGNAWVTAAKHAVSDRVGIDMLAGPSELLVIADASADAGQIAADLLAQAEHDPMASAMLGTTSAELVEAVERELEGQLAALSTADVARAALGNGFACLVETIDQLIELADLVAAEHLEIMASDAGSLADRIRHAGGVFVGAGSAEVLGDFGAGPNHTLPTGGTATHSAGLSVFHFLRPRTHLTITDPAKADGLIRDSIRMAELEGLPGHAEAARRRL